MQLLRILLLLFAFAVCLQAEASPAPAKGKRRPLPRPVRVDEPTALQTDATASCLAATYSFEN